MARLINYFELKQRILEERDKIPKTLPPATYELGIGRPNTHGNSMRGGIRIALRCLEQCQTVTDTVEVIRCKDCHKRYNPKECPMCVFVYGEQHDVTHDDGYCDRGERRTDGRS